MLKSQGMSNRAIAHRLGVSEKAIRKLVGPSKPAESAQLAFAGITTTAAGEPPTSAKSTGDDADRATSSAEDRAGDRDPIAASADDREPVPMSLDRDASDRTFDRQLAYLGLLDDAAPLFREGSSVPGVGVLLALPCLVESGLFRIGRKLYGEIGPAFYGLRTTLLTLLLMALLRIKRPEHLKERDPAAFGSAGSPASRRTIAPSSWARSLRVCVSISADISWVFCTLTAMYAPITANAPSHQRLTWRAAIWPCPPAPTTGSTTAPATRCS